MARTLHPPATGATRLYRSEESLYDEVKARKTATTLRPGALDDQGRPCQLRFLEGTSEVFLVHTHDTNGQELPSHEYLYELLGPVVSGVIAHANDERRQRLHELIAESAGDLAAFRALLAGGEGYVRTYPSEQAFVAANPRARCFPQHDLGFGWREGSCYFRVGFIPESGEVIAVLGGFPHYQRTELLGRVADITELEALLKPLYRLHSKRESLARVRGALQATRPRTVTRQRLSSLAV
jgi:hypothetical protein